MNSVMPLRRKPPVADEFVIELKKPVTMSNGKGDDTIYERIELCEPETGMVTQFQKRGQRETTIDAMKFLISIVSGVPMPVLDKVLWSDFYRAMDYMSRWVDQADEDDPLGNAEGSR